MNTTKLKDALIEMQHQRAILDTAIDQLQKVLVALNGGNQEPEKVKPGRPGMQEGSIPDQGIQILEANGKPMHVVEIAKKVSQIRGREVTRYSMESSFMRHIKSKNPRVRKVGPGIFGLTAWTQNASPQTPSS